ncbi:hypothetical protein NL317_31840, partial [Klebsiella pneumoniae]|nr:hypothetical protein [Klebsiella pneumoniae]
GRASDRRIFLPVEDARCELNPKAGSDATCSITANAAGDLVFTGLPANSPLPATIAKADYTFDVADRNPLFVGIFYMALS